MPLKKKNNKKGGNDDWEAELGESAGAVTPAAAELPAPEGADADNDEDAASGGGLMALMRKNKEKRKKKGLRDDFVEGEDPSASANTAADAPPPPEYLLDKPAAAEANLDDEFAPPEKKGKGGKGGKQAEKVPVPAEKARNDAVDGLEDEDGAEFGRILTKAEKEKLKKEREKQRKKEQVCNLRDSIAVTTVVFGKRLTFVTF